MLSVTTINGAPIIVGSAAATLPITGSTTVTTDAPILDLGQTWNAGGVTFTGIKFDVTNTASAAASLIFDLQVNTVSQFKVSKAGAVTFVGPLTSNTGGTGFDSLGAGILTVHASVASSGIAAWPTWPYGWSTNPGVTSQDTSLYRDAAGIVAIRVSTAAQILRVYNTFTDASNYERASFDWATTANTFRIRSENLGSGTNRIITIDGFDKAGAAANTDLPAGTWALIHDTSGSTVKLVYNDAGTLKTVALV